MSQRYSPPVRRNGFPFEPDAEPGWPRWSDVELEQRPDEPAARRLDGGVQREQVRLVGDIRDHLHDPADLSEVVAIRLIPSTTWAIARTLCTAFSTDLVASPEMPLFSETSLIDFCTRTMDQVPCSTAEAWLSACSNTGSTDTRSALQPEAV